MHKLIVPSLTLSDNAIAYCKQFELAASRIENTDVDVLLCWMAEPRSLAAEYVPSGEISPEEHAELFRTKGKVHPPQVGVGSVKRPDPHRGELRFENTNIYAELGTFPQEMLFTPSVIDLSDDKSKLIVVPLSEQ